MAYATLSDVQALIAGYVELTPDSIPTSVQVQAWCNQKSAVADGALKRAGYTTIPATGTTDKLELKDRVAAACALQALYVALGADNVPATAIEMLSGWREWIKDLGNGDVWLTDQTPTRGRIGTIQAVVYGVE